MGTYFAVICRCHPFYDGNTLYCRLSQSGFGMKGGKSMAEASTKSSSRLAVKMGSVKGSTRPAKRSKLEKDPNKPKRPPGAFFVFMEEFREQYRKKNPNVRLVSVISPAGAAKWKTMSGADKAPFVVKASKLRVEYEKNMSSYNRKQQSGGGSNDAEMGEGSDKFKYEVNSDDDDDDDDDEDSESVPNYYSPC